MKKLKLFLFMLMVSATCLLAQTKLKQIKGKVTDESGVGLPHASVLLVGTKSGVQTDSLGNFTIRIPDDQKSHQLSVSYVGYTPQLASTDGKSFTIGLSKKDASIDEVVVIGYQVKRRKDLVSAISSISAKDIKDMPLNSAEQVLEGRLPGVQVTTSEGSPDASVKIVIRGGMSITQDNSPLYIVDGIPIENALSTLAPQDIESVDVLKDASATAIYGARGANGVIIITTKGGKVGRTNVSYSGYTGYKTLTKELPVLNPYDFITFQYERTRLGRYENSPSTADEATFASNWGTTWDTLSNYKSVPFVDRQHIMMGQNAFTQSHNVSVNGGNETTQFNLSFTNNAEQGIVLNSGYNRNIVSFKMETKVSDKFKVGFNTRFNQQVVPGSGTSDAGSTAYNRLRQSVRYKPLLINGQTTDYYDPNYVSETNGNSLSLINPLLLDQAEFRRRYTNVWNLSGYINYQLNTHISFRSTFGYDINNYKENFFEDTITPDARLNGSAKPIVQITTTDKTTIDNSNVLSFNYQAIGGGHHNIDAVIGQEIYIINTQNNVSRFGGFSPGISAQKAISVLSLGTQFATYPQTSELEAKRLSFFGRVNYDYDKKYLLSVTLRTDGSSKFAEGNRWGYFPSASIGWRIIKEKFMENMRFITDLKLRAGFGATGNDHINDYLYLTQLGATGVYGLNNGSTIGYVPSALANAALKWETNTTRNIGIDAAFFKNRLSLTADVYQNTASNLLIAAPVPSTSGYSTQLQNVGAVTNKGIEISLNVAVIQKKDFNWNASFNISFNKNRIDKLASSSQNYYYSTSGALTAQSNDYIVQVGQSVGSMYGYVTDGFYKVSDFTATANASGIYTYTLNTGVPDNTSVVGKAYPGTLKLKDINGAAKDGKADGLIDANDRTVIGNANPKFTGGLNQTFTYKNFDASIFVNFVYGNNIFNANKVEFTNAYTPDANVLSIEKNRFHYVDATGNVVTDPATLTAMNKNATLWIPPQGTGAGNFLMHSWAIEDGSFLRLSNVTIGYTLPSKLLNRYKINRLRFYVTGNNLAILTKYSGYDPEVNSRRSDPTTPGVDYSAYPRARAFLFGVNVTL